MHERHALRRQGRIQRAGKPGAQNERHRNACERDSDRGVQLPFQALAIEFDADEKHVQHDAELREHPQRRCDGGRQEKGVGLGRYGAEQRRAEHDARHHFANNRRLAEEAKQRPQHAPGHDDRGERKEQMPEQIWAHVKTIGTSPGSTSVLVQGEVLPQQILPVVVPVRRADDDVDVLAAAAPRGSLSDAGCSPGAGDRTRSGSPGCGSGSRRRWRARCRRPRRTSSRRGALHLLHLHPGMAIVHVADVERDQVEQLSLLRGGRVRRRECPRRRARRCP